MPLCPNLHLPPGQYLRSTLLLAPVSSHSTSSCSLTSSFASMGHCRHSAMLKQKHLQRKSTCLQKKRLLVKVALKAAYSPHHAPVAVAALAFVSQQESEPLDLLWHVSLTKGFGCESSSDLDSCHHLVQLLGVLSSSSDLDSCNHLVASQTHHLRRSNEMRPVMELAQLAVASAAALQKRRPIQAHNQVSPPLGALLAWPLDEPFPPVVSALLLGCGNSAAWAFLRGP
mmetsp:Transcript_53124/g.119443  ORF Transcript_53124/g.119443 Transcript_53124/m.119443 type:complete len:228 (-) Transcript_53124:313-996(-)